MSKQERILEGNRNDALTSLAGSMRARGMDADAIQAALEVHNRKRCEPPLEDAEVAVIARSVARYEPNACIEPGRNDPCSMPVSSHVEMNPSATIEDDEPAWPVVFLNGPIRQFQLAIAEKGTVEKKPDAFFQRGGQIVKVVTPTWYKDGRASDEDQTAPWLHKMTSIGVAIEFENHVIFKRFDKRSGKWIRQQCPDTFGKAYLETPDAWECNKLAGVLDHPVITAKGTIIMTHGYDKESKLFFVHRLEIEPIPDHVSREAALDALEEIIETIQEFPFTGEASRATALAMILTPYIRHSVSCVPLFCVTAPVQGTGKTMLASLPSFIATGENPIIITFPDDENELEKKLGAHFMSGARHILIDNVTKVLKNDFLSEVISSIRISTRVLGQSINWVGEPTVCLSATGNNLAIGGDLPRRVLVSGLNVNMENPEIRQFDRNLLAFVKTHRARLI
ncbi:MAG: primase alpha helix C-terminal domain-containing protein, partial [Methylococcales bacterium]